MFCSKSSLVKKKLYCLTSLELQLNKDLLGTTIARDWESNQQLNIDECTWLSFNSWSCRKTMKTLPFQPYTYVSVLFFFYCVLHHWIRPNVWCDNLTLTVIHVLSAKRPSQPSRGCKKRTLQNWFIFLCKSGLYFFKSLECKTLSVQTFSIYQ